MLRSPLLRLLPLLLCLVWFPAGEAFAQQFHNPSMLEPEEMATPSSDDSDVYDDEAEEEAVHPSGKRKRGDGRVSPSGSGASESAPNPEVAEPVPTTKRKPPEPNQASRPPPAPILAPKVSDAGVRALWERWQRAQTSMDLEAARKAQQELLTLREDMGASDLEVLSLGFLRAADARRTAQDPASALQLVEMAVALSPRLPSARLALAEAYARRSLGDVGAYGQEVRAALTELWKDPRHRRAALADLGVMVLLALLATTVVVVGSLFVRRVRYFLHDFHHLFPRVTARWQSVTLALLLLSTAVVMRLGLVPVLLILLAAVALYLTVTERTVAAGLLVLTALVPWASGQLAKHTAFEGTVVEDVYMLERGGLGAEETAARVLARHEQGRASFAELFSLGRFQARRGQLERALIHYKAAAVLRPGHGALLTNMGNVLLVSGDDATAAQIYTQAMQAAPSLAAPAFNLAEVYRRRAAVAPDDQVSIENQRASEALAAAQRVDPSLLLWVHPSGERLLMNRLLLDVPLAEADYPPPLEDEVVAERVEAQVSRQLLGGSSGYIAWGLSVLGALLVFAWGFAARSLRASRECDRCGRSVCRRCDRDLSLSSTMCAQCVNVFQRKDMVEARVRARKQMEVDRHLWWSNGVSYVLGGLVSGAGHLFAGWPVRGALHAFLFLFAVSGVLLRSGVLRAPYGELPLYLKLVPLLLLLIPLYLLSLRGLYRRQNG
jgi:tetratricopeptide (TPR) repeat protein